VLGALLSRKCGGHTWDAQEEEVAGASIVHDLRLCEITIHGSPQHGGDVWTDEAEFDVVDADPNCEKSVFFFPWGVRGCGDEVGGEGGGLVDKGLDPGAEGGNDGGVDGGAAVGEVVGEEGGRVVSIYEVAARRG